MLNKLLTVDIRYENDVVLTRQKARAIAVALNFDRQDQTRIATAASEIARNAFQYAGGGKAEFCIEQCPEKMLFITIRDSGKGIADLDHILSGKYNSLTGMGKGMIGAKRLMDMLRVETQAGHGTSVTLGKLLPPSFESVGDVELRRRLTAIARSPESPYEELREQNTELLRTLDELKEKQSALTHLNRELDETNRGVVALYAELNDKAEFLQRASEMKSNFLSDMSHEFRTPLNSILALTQILLDRLDGELTAEQEKQVRFVRNAANSLAELVSDLLDIAKVEAGKVTMRPGHFTIESLFAALRGMLRPLLVQNASVALLFDEPEGIPELYTDEAKLSQILRNFISNALKFTEKGEIRVSARAGDDGTVILSVADTGIGISLENQDLIFQEWTQVEGKLQKTAKGSGLGLPLSRKLAHLLGGSAYVASDLGVGSTFFVQIPLEFRGAAEVVYAPGAKFQLEAGKLPVLIVEDNREALFLYEKYLKGTKYQAIPAKNLREARVALSEFKPVAVLLDVLLDGEQSWGLLQELKRNPDTNKIPVLVVTVLDNKEKALSLGANGFHEKPISRDWLIRQLDTTAEKETSMLDVLLVDDDAASRYIVKTYLSDFGLHFIDAASGNEGLRLANEKAPDLIVLDLAMPDLTGFEVLDRLKQNERTADIPVIIHTSRDLGKADRERVSQAVGVVTKQGRSREELRACFAEAMAQAGLSVLEIKAGANH